MGPFHLMPGKRFPGRMVEGKLTPMLVTREDFEECCCEEIPEYIRVWDIKIQTRSASIQPDGVWGYGSMCQNMNRSFSPGVGMKFDPEGYWGLGWYYDASSGNPFGQSIYSCYSTKSTYTSRGTIGAPSGVHGFCFNADIKQSNVDQSSVIGGNEYVQPYVAWYDYYGPGHIFTGWTLGAWMHNHFSLRRASGTTLEQGPLGGFAHRVWLSGMGFPDDVIPLSTDGNDNLRWDFVDEDGTRRTGDQRSYGNLRAEAYYP